MPMSKRASWNLHTQASLVLPVAAPNFGQESKLRCWVRYLEALIGLILPSTVSTLLPGFRVKILKPPI